MRGKGKEIHHHFIVSPPEYVKISSSYHEALTIDMEGEEKHETNLTFRIPPDKHWSIWMRYMHDYGAGATIKMSLTPNNTMGGPLWLQLECGTQTPESGNLPMTYGSPLITPPPRSFLLQVSCLHHIRHASLPILFVCVYLSIYLSDVLIPVPSLSVCPSNSVAVFVCQLLYILLRPIRMHVHHPPCLFFIFTPVCLPVSLPVGMAVYLSSFDCLSSPVCLYVFVRCLS